MNRRNVLTLLAALPATAGCSTFAKTTAAVTAEAGKIALTIETDAPTIITSVTSALGIGLQVLGAVGSATPAGAAIAALVAAAGPIVTRVEAAIASSAAPVTADLATLATTTNGLLAAASGSYKAIATAA
jgi:hypothetical protein